MTVGDDIKQALVSARQRVLKEIADYPTPITGCDVQFNYLLAQRELLAKEIAALEDVNDLDDAQSEHLRSVFKESEFVDDDFASKLLPANQ